MKVIVSPTQNVLYKRHSFLCHVVVCCFVSTSKTYLTRLSYAHYWPSTCKDSYWLMFHLISSGVLAGNIIPLPDEQITIFFLSITSYSQSLSLSFFCCVRWCVHFILLFSSFQDLHRWCTLLLYHLSSCSNNFEQQNFFLIFLRFQKGFP